MRTITQDVPNPPGASLQDQLPKSSTAWPSSICLMFSQVQAQRLLRKCEEGTWRWPFPSKC